MKLELRYFDIHGTAQVLRYLLEDLAGPGSWSETGIPVGSEQWRALKADRSFSPFGTLPVLAFEDADGEHVEVAQVLAIAMFLARRFDVLGAAAPDLKGLARIEQLVSCAYLDIIFVLLRAVIYAQQEAISRGMIDRLLPLLDRLQQQLSASDADGRAYFIHQQQVTVADYFMFTALEHLQFVAPGIAAKYPLLLNFYKFFAEKHEKIRAFQEQKSFARFTSSPQDAENVKILQERYPL